MLCGGIDLNQRRFRNFEAYFFSWMFSLWVQQSKLTSAAHRSGVIFFRRLRSNSLHLIRLPPEFTHTLSVRGIIEAKRMLNAVI